MLVLAGTQAFRRMKVTIVTVCAWSAAIAGGNATAADITVIAPLSGTNAILGEAISAGFKTTSNDFKISIVDSRCDAQVASAAAIDAAANDTRMIIGLPCVEALDSVKSAVANTNRKIPVIALGVAVPDITDNTPETGTVFRLGAKQTEEAQTIADYLSAAWREENFALVDDGTLYGRQLTETVRFLLEEDNLKPVFVDNYRPLLERQTGLVRRIEKSGATHVFIGGDAYDVIIIGQDATALNVPLTIAGGAALLAPTDDGILPNGTVFAAPSNIDVKHDEGALSGYAALAAIAKQIALQAIAQSEAEGVDLEKVLKSLTFQTAIGDINFDANGENSRTWMSIYEVQDGNFVEKERVN